MDFLANLHMAFDIALAPINLALCFLGCVIGTFVGVLPGLGPAAVISMLLPITFKLSAVQAIIMLGGLYYGTMYGGSTTSILINLPGEAASVVTCLDGYQMARNGRAGPALGIAAFGSFIAGTVSTVLIMLLAPPLSTFALNFGPPEFAALVFLGLTMVTYLSGGSMVKALIMAVAGLLLGCIGTDIVTGRERFTLGINTLVAGFDIVPIVMGLFGISEVLLNLEGSTGSREIIQAKIRGFLPTRHDWKMSAWPIARGSTLGFLIGLIPGGSGVISSFISYAMEKKVAADPGAFGKGDIRGVAGPESANNASSQASFIPLLTLGIPCNAVIAILFGALMIHGVVPGPRLIFDHPQVFWGVVGSMYIGNAMLLLLNLPLIGIWVRFLRIRYAILFPLILLFCLIGAYTVASSIENVYIMIFFGVAGYVMKKYGYEPAPLVLAFVLAPMFENAFRQSMIISDSNPIIFVNRPLAAFFVALSLLVLLSPSVVSVFRRKGARPAAKGGAS